MRLSGVRIPSESPGISQTAFGCVLALSSRGLGQPAFYRLTRVRIPLGSPGLRIQFFAGIAQPVERLPSKEVVASSILAARSRLTCHKTGLILLQWPSGQGAALRTRRSWVRILPGAPFQWCGILIRYHSPFTMKLHSSVLNALQRNFLSVTFMGHEFFCVCDY